MDDKQKKLDEDMLLMSIKMQELDVEKRKHRVALVYTYLEELVRQKPIHYNSFTSKDLLEVASKLAVLEIKEGIKAKNHFN